MDGVEALVQAIQEEADDLGLNTSEVDMRLSEVLDQIGIRFRHLTGEQGH